ncbi:MAG TPA: LytR C-terminal domain-containing protein [Candidatus Limnocylindrales bacterium]|nr:LytR C-terminal domain-containing protein [Candidatus Limnocylindrales bacterium]
MSEKLGRLMREATAPLHVVWEEPAALRRRAARRRVRQGTALALVSIAALGVGGPAVLGPAGPPPCLGPAPLPSLPELDSNVVAAVSPPRVRVYHGAIGVAENVANELRDRGFAVVEVARTDESMSYHSAVIRYGPDAVGEARLVEAQFVPYEIYMEFDPARTGPVDLLLGNRFQLREACGSPR